MNLRRQFVKKLAVTALAAVTMFGVNPFNAVALERVGNLESVQTYLHDEVELRVSGAGNDYVDILRQAAIRGNGVRFRNEPVTGAIIGSLFYWDTVNILGPQQRGWYPVRIIRAHESSLNGLVGWVAVEYVR